ncbi:MAG: hypothetical protein JNK79_10070 [Chitinophagaceae bacterium]|nr:hypothetical protein [Chitinophagaceae bacterium]
MLILTALIIALFLQNAGNDGIAAKYPNDRNIETDPDVLYAENFEDGLPAIFSRYHDVLNKENMSVDSDVPANSAGQHSLKITNTGGVNTGGHLFRSFDPGFDSTIYIRYYVKYPSISKGYIHHEAVWIGGYDPAISWPNPRAGMCNIDGRLSISYEPVDNEGTMGTYLYWPGMHSWNGGTSCYGNNVATGNKNAMALQWDKWMCIEVMIKMNSPATASNGELRIWQDGKEIGHWGPGFPNGRWTKDVWHINPSAPPFEGFRWRTTDSMKLNYLWIEYFDDKSPAGESHHIKYDNIVIARKYIGPVKTAQNIDDEK